MIGISGLLPTPRTLGLVDRLFDFVLDVVHHVFDLVLRVVELLFGLTRAAIGAAFGFEVLVAGEASNGLCDLALDLISVSTLRAPLFFVVKRGAAPRSIVDTRPAVTKASRTSPEAKVPISPEPRLLRT